MRLHNYAGTCKGISSYILVYNFLMQLFSLKSLVFVMHFLNAFWHGKQTFPKSRSQNEIVSLLIVFHLPYSKCKVVKIYFHSCRYKIKIFHSCRTRVVRLALVWHSCSQCSTRAHSCCSCLTRVALVSLVSHLCRSCRTRVARVWHPCCKLKQIYFDECFMDRNLLDIFLAKFNKLNKRKRTFLIRQFIAGFHFQHIISLSVV